MPDNSTRTPGTGEDIRSIDKSGPKTQVVALDTGGAGAEKLLTAQFDGVAGASDGAIPPAIIRDDVLSTVTPIEGDYMPMRGDGQGATWVRLSETDNSVLDTIDSKLGTIDGDTSTLAGIDFATGSDIATITDRLGEVQASPTANTVLDRLKTIDASIVSLLTELQGKADLAETQPISAASLPLPTGASTSANQSTIIGHLDGVEGLLGDIDAGKLEEATFTGRIGEVQASPTANTVLARLKTIGDYLATIDADTGELTAIKTALEIIDNAISGNEMQVDVVGSLPAGTNAIGKLAANSGVDIGDVDVTSISAGTNVIGATLEVSGSMIENATSVTVKYAIIDAASSGNNTIVAAVTNKKIRVLSLFLVSAGTTTVRFESGADGTALSGQMNLIANTGFVLPHNPHGWFQTADSALLNLELSAAVSVDGSITYIEAE